MTNKEAIEVISQFSRIVNNESWLPDAQKAIKEASGLAIKALAERPQGEWLHPYATDIACECSNCHMQMPVTDYFNFCPNCGVCMCEGEAK